MQTLVNTVNCVGVMGAGIAKTFKLKYPDMFEEYKTRCKRNAVKTGQPYLYRALDRQIVNFPTKQHWRENSKIEYLVEGLKYLVAHIEAWNIRSLAIPPLGCGNGKLDWNIVLPIMLEHLQPLGIPIEIYAPHAAGSFSLAQKRGLPQTQSEKVKRRKRA